MRHHVALILSGSLILGPAQAQELQGNTIVLSKEQADYCREVGCHIIPAPMLQQGMEKVMRQAYEAGVASCGKRT